MTSRAGRERLTRPQTIGVAVLVCVFTWAYALYGLFRHWHFGSSAFDLGIFDQAVWHLSRFEPPASSISGLSNILGDHFSPIIAAFTPLYWIAPAPETLIVAQSFLLAALIVPVFLYLRDRLPDGPALALCVAYGLFWGLQRAAAFDVHEVAFAPLVIATAILAIDRRHWRLFWVAALALTLIKEDLIPLLVFVGMYLLMQGERRQGAVLLVSSLLAFLLVVGLVIPSLNDSGRYSYKETYDAVLQRPWTIPLALVTPSVKLRTALLWLMPFALLPLRSALSVLLVPFALTRFLSSSPNHWGTIFHYSAPLAPILAMSAGDGLARIAGRIDRADYRAHLVRALTGASLLLSSLLPGHQPLWDLFSPEHYRTTQFPRTGYRVIERIPEGASVVAQAAVVAHISHRERVYVFDAKAPDADFVVASTGLSPWPHTSYADLARLLHDRRGRGYTVLLDENGWTVLRRR